MFNYKDARQSGYSAAEHALRNAPAVFSTNELIDAHVRQSKWTQQVLKNLEPGAKLGFDAGVREAVREYWDKTYHTPIFSEDWRVAEMFLYPARYNVRLDCSREQRIHMILTMLRRHHDWFRKYYSSK